MSITKEMEGYCIKCPCCPGPLVESENGVEKGVFIHFDRKGAFKEGLQYEHEGKPLTGIVRVKVTFYEEDNK